MNHRKKGNIILGGLALMLLFMTLFSIYLTLSTSWEAYNRVQTAVEEGAKVRAQAVDIYLKEAAGIIEAFHEQPAPSGTYGAGAVPDVDHSAYTHVAGHLSPLVPTDSTYIAARQRADQGAKDAIISILQYSLNGNTAGHEILEGFSENNICIQVKPLPRDRWDDLRMDFECTTGHGEEIKVNNVKVTPVKGDGPNDTGINRKVVFDPDGTLETGDEHIVQVVNVVFVGVSFEHRHFMEGFLSDWDKSITGKKKVWAIAYPQIDECFGEFC